jgi:fibronectin-binding autotransporter adhesin
MRRLPVFVVVMALGFGSASSARAQATWTGSTATTWNNAAAWSTGSVPTASTAVVLQPSAAVNMTIPNTVIATATSVNFASASNMTLVISDGGRLNVGGAIADTGAGNASMVVNNTTAANAATVLTATSIALYDFSFNGGGNQFLRLTNADVALALQMNIGSASGTATYRQAGGSLSVANGSYGLTLIEASSANPTGTATFILDGGRVSADRIGVANANGNNGAVARYAANGTFRFLSGTVQPREGQSTFFQNGSARSSGATTDTQFNTSKPLSIELSGTGVNEFNATGSIWVTQSAQIRNVAGQAGSLLKTGSQNLILTGDGPVAVNDWTGASTVRDGSISVNFSQIAGTATSSGTTALANAYSPASQLVLDGGGFQLTGRANAAASSQTNRSINAASYNLTVTSTAGLVVGQAVTNPNLPAGTYIRRITNATTVELNAMITGTTNLTGQTFDFAAANFTNSQTVNDVLLQQTGTVTVSPAGDSTLLSFGTVSGPAGFVKAGTGTLRLTGPLSYSGTTNLSAGTIDFALGSGTTTLAGSVIGSGTFLKTGNGTMIIGGVGNTFTGPLSVTAGTLQIGTASTANVSTQALGVTSAVTVAAGANLVFKNGNAIQNASSLLVSGTISTDVAGVTGGGFVNKLGNGPITMSGGAILANSGGNSSNFQSYALGGDVTVGGSGPSTLSVAPGALATAAGVHLTWNTAEGTTRTFTVADATGDASADLIVSARLINTANTLAATNLSKAGLGTMLLSASNAYTGATTVGAGILDFNTLDALRNTSGVTIAGGATLRYSGASGAFDRPITVTAGSGTGTVRNSSGGLLTLSGNLSKDNSVLRLTGGAFNVTGTISGTTPGASDLLVDGTSSVTLSAVNTYDGPTFVIESSTLTYGVANAIPATSVVNLGNASSQGTLNMNGFTGAIGGLAFGSGGGTLRLAATSTSAPVLTAATGTMNLANGTLDLAGSGTSAGLYRVLSAQSITGAFSGTTGLDSAYRILATGSTLDLQQRAVLGSLSITNTTTSIITGGAAAFTYSVANNALSGGAALSFTGTGLSNIAGTSNGTAAAGGSSGAISGLSFTGTSIGAGQLGTFTVSDPAAFGVTSLTGTVSVNVLDHALPGFQAAGITDAYTQDVLNIDFGSIDQTAGMQNFTYNLLNLASQTYGAELTAGLDFTGVTADGDGFASGLTTFNNLVGGGTSSLFTLSFTPTGQGTFSKQFTLSFSDNRSLAGASARRDLTINAQVIVVPEPTALALAAMAAAWCGARALRRRRPGVAA